MPYVYLVFEVHCITLIALQFYNLVLFMSSVAVFSIVAQRMTGPRALVAS